MKSERPYGFVKALEFTLPWECGHPKKGEATVSFGSILLPADGGLNYHDGEATKWGIYKRANPDVDVENLTLDQAIALYKEKYWDTYLNIRPVSANLDNLPTALAVATFDAGVNTGTSRAIRWLGKGLESKTPHRAVNDLRGAYYFDLVSQDKERFGKNYKGWIARLTDLKKYCDVLEAEDQAKFELNAKVKKVQVLGYDLPSTE